MKITQIRNATILLEYAGKRFLVDPMLSQKGVLPAIPGSVNSHLQNPLVDLPLTVEQILSGVDAVIVTHTHFDHWDVAAMALIPKDMLIFAQNEQDEAEIKSSGFHNIRVLSENTLFDGITLIRTPGQHGSDEAIAAVPPLGHVIGVVFKHSTEKTVYLAGDTVWNDFVEDNVKQYSPDVAILNCGDAQLLGLGGMIMTKEDVWKMHQLSPKSTIVATHLEGINACILSRKELREYVKEKGISGRVFVPNDGESFTL